MRNIGKAALTPYGFNPISGRKVAQWIPCASLVRSNNVSIPSLEGRLRNDYEEQITAMLVSFNPISGREGYATLTISTPHKHWLCRVRFRDDF